MKTLVPTVYIVDDDEAVRSSLRLLIRSVGLQAQAFVSAMDFLASYDPRHPGCLLLDVRMPGMSGLELQQELNRRGATIPVVFITGHGDVPMAVAAMQQGAFDFLQKPFRDQDLLDRVQRGMARDAESRGRLAAHAEILARLATLTPRETEVMRLVTSGKANKVVGGELGVSQRTVEIHRAHVMEKMRAGSLAELVRMVLDSEDSTQNP
jgi:two-component system, LuxR family, response regulator FixJ